MMTEEQLKKKHPIHDEFIDAWTFFDQVYEGGRTLIDTAITRNERESWQNFNARKDEAFPLNYAASIVDLFNFYLFEKKGHRHMGKIADDKRWQMFEKDADLNGTDFDKFITDSQKMASVFGYAGILVNKGGTSDTTRSVADEVRLGLYPYCARYTPPNILDWAFAKDPLTHRRFLTYLKLYEGENRYIVWYPNSWEEYKFDKMKDKKPILIGQGVNPLGMIPFVWMRNLTHLKYAEIGISDIKDIAYVVASLIRNMSSGEEIIKYAGFPMLRKPKDRDTDEEEDSAAEDVIGLKTIQEFDPEFGGDGKPDWMPTEIAEPIDAVLKWWDRKVDEIYRMAHLSGVHGQRKSNNEVASGMALRYEFQQLNSVMIQKSANLNESEMAIAKLWARWQKYNRNEIDAIQVTRSKSFSIDDLAIDLDNTLKAMRNVLSKTFRTKVQKQIVKKTLPDLADFDYEKIQKEIDSNEPEVDPEETRALREHDKKFDVRSGRKNQHQ